VARADRRRSARAKPVVAASRRHQSAYVGTEGLFFQRLRRQAKWVFVFLAAAFAIGFVAFGVGSDVQGGIADIIGQGRVDDSGQVSVEEAQEKLAKNPNDEQALRELARALQTEGRPEEAITPLETFTALKPKDEDALRELASLYLTQATRLRTELQFAQAAAAEANPGAVFAPAPGTPFGSALTGGKVVDAAAAKANERVNGLLGELSAAYQNASRTYKLVADLSPEDAALQITLADAALNAGDTATAIEAYKKFLELAPDDPTAPAIRERIKQLEGIAVTPPPQQ
jgi:tetratricopeptide (TPR) repeat protein